MLDPLFFFAISSLIVKSAPLWLPPIRDAFLGKAQEKGMDLLFDTTIDKGKKGMRSLFRSDEKEQARHLELVLKNALERGEVAFHTPEEQQQYRSIITTLCQPSSQSEILRREVMRLFSLNENPNFTELNEVYHRLLPQSTSSSTQTPVDAAPYLGSFIDALLAELYADPFFKQQLSDVIQVRAAISMQRSLTEVVATLHQIGETLADHYTPEQFEQDVQAYTAHIERTLRYLKLVGVVPKERTHENRDPELDGIFVPLRIGLQKERMPDDQQQDSIVDVLEHSSCVMLLGGPGSGKSTATRHLAWSHAVANLASSISLSNTALLAGKPLPLRIELRRLVEDRRQRPDYDFLTYASEVLLGRAGVIISPRMFEILLERRTMLLLFDGLDEVATLDERRTLVDEIESFSQRYPGNRFMVTSRPVGYELAPLSEQIFSHAKVQPFNDEQIHLFLENWYTHVLRLSPLSPDDEQELEELYTTLKGKPRLYDLAENPLLLTVITALHRYERLPDKRILVYDRCADLLLETWAKLRGTKERWNDLKLSKEDQYACVAHLGFFLHKRAQEQERETDSSSTASTDVDVPFRLLLHEIERFLHQQSFFASRAEEHMQARRFLELIQEEAGLIVERGIGENNEPLYGFVHRTFQEYFAAADLYERYRQEEEPIIISKFLRERLHDPQWLEVILLLFGKLGRKPATRQLRQILEGKLKSRRSKCTEIVQQDLFFISTCLIEEISVENDLAAFVISQLCELAKRSPFPSQRNEALKTLIALEQRRQYTTLAQQALKTLIAYYQVVDLSTQIDIAFTLFQGATVFQSRQEIKRWLLTLAQRSDLPVEQFIEAAESLYQSSPLESEVQRLATQFLFDLAHSPKISFKQTIQAATNLYQSSASESKEQQFATRLLFDLTHRPDLSNEQALEANYSLYQSSSDHSQERKLATRKFLDLIQRPNIPMESLISTCHILSSILIEGSYQNRRQAFQIILRLLQRDDLSTEEAWEIGRLSFNGGFKSKDKQQAIQILFNSLQQPGISFEETLRIAQTIYWIVPATSDEEQRVIQILFDLIRTELPIEQAMQVIRFLIKCSPALSPDEFEQISSILLNFMQSDLSFEQAMFISKIFYEDPYYEFPEQQNIQMLWGLIQNQDLTTDQRLQAAMTILTESSYQERIRALQIILTLYKEETAKQFIEKYRKPSSRQINPEVNDISSLIKLANEKILPIEVRDDMYQKLRDMIPQFDKLDEAHK